MLVESTLKAADTEEVDYKSLVLLQANLLAVVMAYGDKRKNDKAYSMVGIQLQYCVTKELLHRVWTIFVNGKQDSVYSLCALNVVL